MPWRSSRPWPGVWLQSRRHERIARRSLSASRASVKDVAVEEVEHAADGQSAKEHVEGYPAVR